MQEMYSFLLSQGIGAPSVPVVSLAEHVARGQKIATMPEGKLGSNIFASVSGVVESISEKEIKIKADATQSPEYVKLSGDSPLELIKESGLVGLGGAGFPTYVKIGKPFSDGGSIIVNAAECEPILSHNIEFIEKHPEKVIRGLEILMEVTNASEGVVALKAIHPEAIEALKGAIKNPKMRVATLPNMYPMGEERAIVREVLGPVLPITALPMQAKAIITNLETTYRAAEAVDDKKPLIDKDMTVAGKIKGDNIQTYFDIPIGTTVGEMIERAGGIGEDFGEIIMGGPFTGKKTSMEAPVVKTTGGIIVTQEPLPAPDKIGLLVCACGANEERLAEIAKDLGSEVVGVEYCKQAKEPKPGAPRKCENPGRCPGQVQKVMALKKAGAKAVLISNCTDCSNTVMSCAPQLKLPVYHCTDGALRAVNMKLIRRIRPENQ